MIRIATICTLGTVLFVASSQAADAPAAAPAAAAAMEKVDCGKMLKEKSAMPAKAAELHALLADMLDHHSKAMSQIKTKEAKAEANAVAKISRENKQASERLKKLSESMEAAGNLQPAEHEPPKPDAKHAELMTKFLSTEKELAELLKKDVEAMEQSMKAKR